MKNTLIQIFHKLNAAKQGDFTLASGKKSDFYVDARVVNSTAEGIVCVCKCLNELNFGDYDTIGGMAMGANPIVSGMLTYNYLVNLRNPGCYNGFYWRKEQKTHGLKRPYEGIILPNAKILLVDDVATTGDSLLEVHKQLMQLDLNVTVVAAAVVVDRQEGAKEALAAQGIPLFAILTKQELLESLATV